LFLGGLIVPIASTPIMKRRRSLFAVLRVVQFTCFGLSILCVVLLIQGARLRMVPQQARNSPNIAPFMAVNDPRLIGFTAAGLASFALLLQCITVPLRKRWKSDLRGWIS